MGEDTWELTDIPPDITFSGNQMLCERKRSSTGGVERNKGLLVARGETQIYGVDHSDVWAPVARYSTLRVLLAYSVVRGLPLSQMDVETAVLNGQVAVEICIRQPPGYKPGDRSKV